MNQEPRFDHRLDRSIGPGQMIAQRMPLIRGITDAELGDAPRRDLSIREIGAGPSATRTGEPGLEERGRLLQHFVKTGALFLVFRRSRACAGAGCKPASVARRSTASRKLRPSVAITKSKMLPFLPDEKSNQAILPSLTKKEGVFSALNGDSPRHSRPAFLSFTRRPTTSDTGRRDLISSKNSGDRRIPHSLDVHCPSRESGTIRRGAGIHRQLTTICFPSEGCCHAQALIWQPEVAHVDEYANPPDCRRLDRVPGRVVDRGDDPARASAALSDRSAD